VALASLSEAWTQYDASLRWWESSTHRDNLLEACLYIMGHQPQSQSHAGRSYTRAGMDALIEQLTKAAKADSNNRGTFSARVRIRGLGRFS